MSTAEQRDSRTERHMVRETGRQRYGKTGTREGTETAEQRGRRTGRHVNINRRNRRTGHRRINKTTGHRDSKTKIKEDRDAGGQKSRITEKQTGGQRDIVTKGQGNKPER